MYDLVIKGGKVIDPAQGIDGAFDVAFEGGKVAAIKPGIASDRAREVLSASGLIVVPGLIDLHTHVWWGGSSLSVRPEPVARRSGATTLVDAGSAGPGNFHGFRELIIEPSPVRILPYDAALFELTEGSYDYMDVMGERMTAGRRLELRHIVKGGRLWHTVETD